MLHEDLISEIVLKKRSRICLIGLPSSGKSTLAKELRGHFMARGNLTNIISMNDLLTINKKNQKKLLDIYRFICSDNFTTIIFDGWPAESPPDSAISLCDQVWLVCQPPWLFLARRRARGEDIPDTSKFWSFYHKEVPDYLENYRDSGKFHLVEFYDGVYRPIEEYSEWLERAADPYEEDEKSLLKEIRPKEYQRIDLPFGGKINGSDTTEKIVRTVLKYLPGRALIKRAVDVGCEFGMTSFMLARWGVWEVDGIDHDQRCIQIAKKLQKLFYSHVNFTCMKGEFFDFNNVDLVLCLSVSHHLPEPQYLYSQIMRAKWIVVELPLHKFSILEEASQRLNRVCIAAWPSPKRDREVRIYCHPDVVPARIPVPEQELDRKTYLNSGRSQPGGKDFSYIIFVADQEISGGKSHTSKKAISYTQFARLSYTPAEKTDTIECEIDFTTGGIVPVWLQYNWHFKSGTLKMVGQGYRFAGDSRITTTQQKPLEHFHEPVTRIDVIVRPSPGEENEIKINSITVIDRS